MTLSGSRQPVFAVIHLGILGKEHIVSAYAASKLHPDGLKSYTRTAKTDTLTTVPTQWCTDSAELVHGGRGRGAPGHTRNYSEIPLRLRMDSPSIWII